MPPQRCKVAVSVCLDLARGQHLGRILALVEQQAERLAAIERRLAIEEGR